MNVKELKDLLEGFPEDYIVVIAEDAEGNGFKELEAYSEGHCERINSYSLEFTSGDEQPNALCLWP